MAEKRRKGIGLRNSELIPETLSNLEQHWEGPEHEDRRSRRDRRAYRTGSYPGQAHVAESKRGGGGGDTMAVMIRVLIMSSILFMLLSCTHTYQYTYTKKSAIEQLLVTKAINEAIQKMVVDIKRSKVFVDVACLMKDEQPYIKKALSHSLLDAGVLIADFPWNADYVFSVLVRVAGTDGEQYLLGVPSIPIPLAAGMATPALSVYSQMNQKGRVEMEVMIYSEKEGLKEKIQSLKGESYYKKYVILFVPYTEKDIP